MRFGAVGRSVVWFAIGAILASAGWLAVQRSHRPAARTQDARVLRSYDVRPDLAVEIRNALTSALGGFGTVGIAPSGQILVNAPPSLQKGVEQLVQEVAARKPPATPSIHIEVWFVTASPGAPVNSPNLKEIEPALRAIEQSKGPSRFGLLEELSTQTQSGERSSEVQGARTSMLVNVSVLRDSQDRPIIAAQLNLHSGQRPGIIARTELHPGELLVLGQSGFPDKDATDRKIYYIVRATL